MVEHQRGNKEAAGQDSSRKEEIIQATTEESQDNMMEHDDTEVEGKTEKTNGRLENKRTDLSN